MSLISELKAKDKKGLYSSSQNVAFYSTGFGVLDYANGTWMQLIDKNNNAVIRPMLGLQGGSLNSVIGTVGTGKTTLAVQIGWNIVRKFENGLLILNDCEKLSNAQRIATITGTEIDEERILLNKDNSDIDSTLKIVSDVCDMKESAGKNYMYKIEDASVDGKPFWVYQPTVLIVDSLPAFNSVDYNTENLGNQIDQMKASKDITRFYTNILYNTWKYNIILIAINHVRPASNTNQYAPPVQGLIMINSQTESLPRGHVAQYFSGTYLRVRTKKGDACTEEDNGFRGYVSAVSIAKSKTNIIGTSFPLAFNHAIGYDPIYSHFAFAQEVGLVQGRNPYLYFAGAEDYKFKRRDFFNKFCSDIDFRLATMRALEPHYTALLGPKPEVNVNADGTITHISSLHKQIQAIL